MLDILDPRATPAIDRLVIVTHHGNTTVITGQQPQPGILDGVGVLKLVNQDVVKTLAVVLAQAIVVTNQFQ